MTEDIISTGFDRGIDYDEIKEKLNKSLEEYYKSYQEKKKKMDIKRMIYNIISQIQLRNGSRISEAVRAFIKFLTLDIDKRVVVKISKSDAVKIKKDGEKKKMKARFREMMFPKWIKPEIFTLIKKSKTTNELVGSNRLKKRVLDYLLLHQGCNTHSLRYACINNLIYVQKRPINDVAKWIGHQNVAQMVTYTQKKNADQIFDIDM